MSLLLWVLIAKWVMAQSQTPKIVLNIEPRSLSIGQSAILSWKVTDGDKVFISQLGKVDVYGQEKINPDETTTYSLVAEGPHGVATSSITVEVSGAKGGIEFPKEDNFKYQFSYKATESSVTKFLDHLHKVLQDSLSFSLREYQVDKGPFIFLTNMSQKNYLLEKQETRIGARRIAYLVEVMERKAQELNYTIKTLIDYRRKIERTWREEGDEALYQQQVHHLQELIIKQTR